MCADPPDTAARQPLAVNSMAAADGLELGGGLVPRGDEGLGRLQLRTGAVAEGPLRSTAQVKGGIQKTYVSPSDRGYGDGTAGSASGISRRGRPSNSSANPLTALTLGAGYAVASAKDRNNRRSANASKSPTTQRAAQVQAAPTNSVDGGVGGNGLSSLVNNQTSGGDAPVARPYVNTGLRLL